MNPLLRVEHLKVEFPVGRTGLVVHAVSDLSLTVEPGETLGIVGESGCGKSTTARAIMQLIRPTSGQVMFDGVDLTTVSGRELRRVRAPLQMVFQDPISSLNPRRTAYDIVMEPLVIHRRGSPAERRAKVDTVLDEVGIDPRRAAESRVHQFSGGQCQRISIARALVLEPRLVICDEPVSSLDVSVQAQVLNLLEDLKANRGLSMLFIAHDLAVVKNISDRVAVMYLGTVCEVASPDVLFSAPAHHYTALLMAAIPRVDIDQAGSFRGLDRHMIEGEPPSPVMPPTGCRFHPRCPAASDLCRRVQPALTEIAPGHQVACHHPVKLPTASPSS